MTWCMREVCENCVDNFDLFDERPTSPPLLPLSVPLPLPFPLPVLNQQSFIRCPRFPTVVTDSRFAASTRACALRHCINVQWLNSRVRTVLPGQSVYCCCRCYCASDVDYFSLEVVPFFQPLCVHHEVRRKIAVSKSDKNHSGVLRRRHRFATHVLEGTHGSLVLFHLAVLESKRGPSALLTRSPVRRPVRLEEPEQSLGHAGQHGSQRGEGVSCPRPAEWCVREPHVLTQAPGQSAAGR